MRYLVPGPTPCPEVVAIFYIRPAEVPTLFSVEGDAQVEQQNTVVGFLTYFICLGRFFSYLQRQANISLRVLDPNVKDMYFRHRWDTEQYSASMKQLEDAVHCFLPFIIALSLLTTLVSLTGIILRLRKVQKQQKRLLQVCFCYTLHLCPALTSTC